MRQETSCMEGLGIAICDAFACMSELCQRHTRQPLNSPIVSQGSRACYLRTSIPPGSAWFPWSRSVFHPVAN